MITSAKKLIIFFALLLILVIPAQSFARDCSDYQFDKAEYFAKTAGKKYTSQYSPIKNVYTKMTSCNFNSYTETFDIGMYVTWQGGWVGTEYRIDAQLSVDEDGSNAQLESIRGNEALNNYKTMTGGIVASILILGILSNSE
jgi:hypothetical protein